MQGNSGWMEIIFFIAFIAISALGALGKKLRGEGNEEQSPSPRPPQPKYPVAKPRAPRPGEKQFGATDAHRPESTMKPPPPQRRHIPIDRPQQAAQVVSQQAPQPPHKSPARSLRDQLVEALEKLDPHQPPARTATPSKRLPPAPVPKQPPKEPKQAPPQSRPQTRLNEGLGKPITEQAPAQIQSTGSGRTIKGKVLNDEQLKRAIVWSEILKPPVSLRDPEAESAF
jgi:hypothetical protein